MTQGGRLPVHDQGFRALIENLPVGMALVSGDGRILYDSPSSARIMGYALESTQAVDIFQHIHPEDLALVQATFVDIVGRPGEVRQVEVRTRRDPSEPWRWVEATGQNLLHDPYVGAIVCYFRDVTSRHDTELELRANHALLETAQAMGRMGSFTSSGDVFTWSREMYRIFGVAEHEPPPSWVWFIEHVHPEDRAKVQASLASHPPNQPFDVDYRLMRPDGELRWVRCYGTLTRGADGGIATSTGILQDVTARKALEEELLQARKLESVGRLAGGLAHDFHNLLTAIMNYAHFAGEAVPEGNPAHDDLHELQRAAARAAELTGQLLAFARKRVVEPRVVDVCEVVGSMQRLLRRSIPEAIELHVSLAGNSAPVRIDPGQLEQILMNLALNARDAMPGGGVLRLIVDTLAEGAPDRPRALQPGPYVVLAVADTGEGMAPEVVAHMFEPFFTTKELGRGTGLGLATCWGIVQQAGGHIDVVSTPGDGTRFRVMLPRAGEPVRMRAPTPLPVPAANGHETVLLVEDEPMVRAAVARGLDAAGYQVIQADDAEHALALLAARGSEIHLLLTDLVMPHMSGIELTRRARITRPGLAMLLMSGYSEEAVEAEGNLEAGTELLSKPFSVDELARRVRGTIDKARGGA